MSVSKITKRLKRVMQLAHSIVSEFRKSGVSYRAALSQAMSQAWKKVKLKEALHGGMVRLTFMKKSTKESVTRLATSKPVASVASSKKAKPWYIVNFFQPKEENYRSCDIRFVQGWEVVISKKN